MNSQHVLFYFCPEHVELARETVACDHLELARLVVNRNIAFGQSLFPISFEDALSELEKQFNAYTEGDGSFGCAGNTEAGTWRISGTIFESQALVSSVDLWIDAAPSNTLRKLMGIFSSELGQMVAEFPDRAFHTDFEESCRYLESQI